MDILFQVLTGLVILQGCIGAIDGLRYLRYIRLHLATEIPPWTPFASVVLPCKGLDHGLSENVHAVLTQNYPNYEVILVTATSEDPSLPLLHNLAAGCSKTKIKFVTAGLSSGRGEKVNNLIQAVAQVDGGSEVLVFTDSDSRPHSSWLRDLVAPLQQEKIGVSTGYRWFFPSIGNFASVLRSAWNGSIATLLGNHDHNFSWGGSMAVKREIFDRVRVLEYWKHSVSDDYSLTRAIREAGLKIHYEPRCLVASHGDCNLRELLEWSTRQIIITRVYSPKLWKLALAAQIPFVVTWWWAVGQFTVIGWKILVAQGGTESLLLMNQLQYLGSFAGLVLLMGSIRGYLRLRAVGLIRPEGQPNLRRFWWGYMLLAPLVSSLMAYNLVASCLTSTIKWRNVRYELKSASQVRVIRSQ